MALTNPPQDQFEIVVTTPQLNALRGLVLDAMEAGPDALSVLTDLLQSINSARVATLGAEDAADELSAALNTLTSVAEQSALPELRRLEHSAGASDHASTLLETAIDEAKAVNEAWCAPTADPLPTPSPQRRNPSSRL